MKAFRRALHAAFLLAWLSSASAQTWPAKPIRFIVAYSTGGLADTFARAMGQHLGQRLGQPFVIENRPGASQVIALDALAKAPADGYTIAYGTQSGLVFATGAKKTLPYDPLKDFAPVGLLFETPFYLLVHPSIPAKNVQELIGYVKANPGKLSFASVGVGSGQHLAMELFRSRTGIDMVHVPYKGTGPAAVDMVAGRVQVMFEGPTTTASSIRAGKLRVLASSGTQRTRSMPDIPTVAEAGVPGFDISAWFGLQTNAGVPRTVIDRLNQEVNQWLVSAEVRDTLADKFALDVRPSTPEQMGERVAREIPVFIRIMRNAGIEPE